MPTNRWLTDDFPLNLVAEGRHEKSAALWVSTQEDEGVALYTHEQGRDRRSLSSHPQTRQPTAAQPGLVEPEETETAVLQTGGAHAVHSRQRKGRGDDSNDGTFGWGN